MASAALLRPLPRRWHMYVWPFVSMLYPVFIYVYYNHYDTYIGSEEWTFVSLGSIITLHAMTFLVCQWSVDVQALFTCVKVRYYNRCILSNIYLQMVIRKPMLKRQLSSRLYLSVIKERAHLLLLSIQR